MRPFVEEAILQVSNGGFDLEDLKVQKKCQTKVLLLWLKSMYIQAECDIVGFLGLIHIWQFLTFFPLGIAVSMFACSVLVILK